MEAITRVLDPIRTNPALARRAAIVGTAAAALLIGGVALWRAAGRAAPQADGPVATSRGSHAVAHSNKAPVQSPLRAHAVSADYEILLKRSMFSSNGSPAGANAQSLAAQQQQQQGGSTAAPSTFALKGISQEDASFTAFVEDTVARRVIEVHAGDVLGQGQVRDMTLRDLNYAIDGKVVHVEIGQGLDGNPVASSTVPESSTVKPQQQQHKHKHDAPGADVRASTLDGQ